MQILKKLAVLVLGTFISYCLFNYFLDDKKSFVKTDKNNISENELAVINSKKLDLRRDIASAKNGTNTDFFQNTYEVVANSNGKPKYQLKHGKRYYNEEYMEEISTSANIEVISRDE